MEPLPDVTSTLLFDFLEVIPLLNERRVEADMGEVSGGSVSGPSSVVLQSHLSGSGSLFPLEFLECLFKFL